MKLPEPTRSSYLLRLVWSYAAALWFSIPGWTRWVGVLIYLILLSVMYADLLDVISPSVDKTHPT